MGELVRIPPGHGKAVRVEAGASVCFVNTHVPGRGRLGVQRPRPPRVHVDGTQAWNCRINVAVGDVFVTNRHRPILTLTEDTSSGVHDTLMSACDRYRYHLLGCEGYHCNCQDNMVEGLSEFGVAAPFRVSGS